DLFTTNGYFWRAYSTNSYSPTNELQSEVREMLWLADAENHDLLDTNYEDFENPRKPPKIHWWHRRLPPMTSPDLPVGVAVVSRWNENPGNATETASSNPANTNQEQVTFDKLLVTIQAASSTTTKSSGNTNAGTHKAESASVTDFEPEQQVTLNLSTVLNSASTLDRIDYVSTYVYIYPWPMSLDGNVVLEREFWRKFFALNAPRDPLVQTNSDLLESDIQEAMDSLRVRVHDVSTTVTNVMVNLGSETQTFGSQNQIGLSASPQTVPITLQLGHTESASTMETIALEQQLDQRSTYIDSAGDFFRITQRGMKSVDLAGRFKDVVTLHIPAAAEPVPVLILNPNVNAAATVQVTVLTVTTNKVQITNATSQLVWTNIVQTNATPLNIETNLVNTNGPSFDVQYVSEPLFSEVDAITFSVVVARRTTALAATPEDTYGLDDRSDAAFIVGVTVPQRVKLWQWERRVYGLTTRDLGLTNNPVQPIRVKFPYEPSTEPPHPLYLASFDTSQADMEQQYYKLLGEIRYVLTNRCCCSCPANFAVQVNDDDGYWEIVTNK
ncbi:MAG: hypothetical protein KGR98_08700, partial [Verrucomicrobia bacterium]|nr:hypothetical protein [Verrucomicrobiota bacterium]